MIYARFDYSLKKGERNDGNRIEGKSYVQYYFVVKRKLKRGKKRYVKVFVRSFLLYCWYLTSFPFSSISPQNLRKESWTLARSLQ